MRTKLLALLLILLIPVLTQNQSSTALAGHTGLGSFCSPCGGCHQCACDPGEDPDPPCGNGTVLRTDVDNATNTDETENLPDAGSFSLLVGLIVLSWLRFRY
jgi:hypothetical protein